MNIEISEWQLTDILRHLKRISDCALSQDGDTRTANALRLARKDTRRLEALILRHKTHKDHE